MAISDRELIAGGVRHWLREGEPIVFLTITEGRDARPFRDSAEALSGVLKALRRINGDRAFAYVAIPEAQKRGAVHWHLLVAGFRYPMTTRTRAIEFPGHGPSAGGVKLNKRMLEPILERHGFGTGFVGLRAVATATLESLCQDPQMVSTLSDDERAALTVEINAGRTANYLSKYLTKSGLELLDLPAHTPLLRSSSARAWYPGHSLVELRQAGRPVDHLRQVIEEIREEHHQIDRVSALVMGTFGEADGRRASAQAGGPERTESDDPSRGGWGSPPVPAVTDALPAELEPTAPPPEPTPLPFRCRTTVRATEGAAPAAPLAKRRNEMPGERAEIPPRTGLAGTAPPPGTEKRKPPPTESPHL